MNREPWSDIGRLQQEMRQLKNDIQNKADDHKIHEINRKLDCLERSLREISSRIDTIQYELQVQEGQIETIMETNNED